MKKMCIVCDRLIRYVSKVLTYSLLVFSDSFYFRYFTDLCKRADSVLQSNQVVETFLFVLTPALNLCRWILAM